MFNLCHAIGEVNGRRSNYSMAIIEGEKREFGKCYVEIKSRKVEPREEIRGEIARTYMYMDSVYPGRGIISKKNWKLFESWHRRECVSLYPAFFAASKWSPERTYSSTNTCL